MVWSKKVLKITVRGRTRGKVVQMCNFGTLIVKVNCLERRRVSESRRLM
jgi:hypothetical protein